MEITSQEYREEVITLATAIGLEASYTAMCKNNIISLPELTKMIIYEVMVCIASGDAEHCKSDAMDKAWTIVLNYAVEIKKNGKVTFN